MSTLVSTPRRRRRAALAAALAMIAAPLVVSSSAEAAECVAGVPCVIVKVVSVVDGKKAEYEYTVNIQENADLKDAEDLAYTVRSKRNGPITPVEGITEALSLNAILDRDNGGDADDWTFSETSGRSKVPSVLDPDMNYRDGLVPAVYVTGGRVGYVRPLAGNGDVNAGDVFVLPAGAPLVLTIHTTGELLDVTTTATPKKKVTTATPVFFTAEVAPESDTLSYRWTLGTKVYKTAKPSRTFTKSDTYPVNLVVRDDKDGSLGLAATTSVKVGKPPKPPSTNGTGGGGGGIGPGTGGGGFIPPYIPNDAPSPPSDATPPPTSDLPTGPIDDGLTEVEGFVLAGAGSGEGESIPGTQATSQPTQADELSTSRKISGAVIGALAVLLLLGLGAEIETRWASTRLAHLRRRT
ncbi:PKD domain-containing protein [Aeromicrobium sp. NPDC092404]|uniref:PKD domain-containing protein n=1 Tax=Aeromicrobium sp. NPDC092404 TaxID=3154976 RepID=UPI00343C60D7